MDRYIVYVLYLLAFDIFIHGEADISNNETDLPIVEEKLTAIDNVVKALEVLENHAASTGDISPSPASENKAVVSKSDPLSSSDSTPAPSGISSILQLFTSNLTTVNITEEVAPTPKKANCSRRNESTDETQVKMVNASTVVSHLNALGDTASLNESGPCSVVMFYAPWCRFSAYAAPHFNALARAYPDITLMAVDAASAYNMNTRYGVMGVPTFMLFHNGRPVVKYNLSTYTLQELSDFVQGHTGLNPAVLLNVTTQDFYGPVPCTPEDSLDPWLWASWCFLASLLLLVILRSRFTNQLLELIRRTWREAEGLHEHTD